ncbi:hypothetical protein B0H15DRAFT_831500 [Mycena belliarum]|uniref:Rhodopsin domain-containing protein n=1 Tax=Mycena belliarum TaxID=1033014 RepID=A0AAD6U8H1_9AGAR|nr:hypothetical protein B0H15DRAFT_831500 [Mycena belliae]
MVAWVQPSLTTNRIVTTTLLGTAQVATFLRLAIRIRSKRLWLDDAWAILALLFSYALLINMWMRTDLTNSRSQRIIAYWIVNITFTCTLWASRMSVIFSIIRIIPHSLTLRRITSYLAVLFGLMWTGLLVKKVHLCASDRSWYHLPQPQCHLGRVVGIMELATDSVADLGLAIVPMELLRRAPTIVGSQRMLVLIIFGANLLTAIVSVVHAVYLLGPAGLLEAISAQAEAAVALLISSAGVIVPPIYRLCRNQTPTYPEASTVLSDDVVLNRVGVVFRHPDQSTTSVETMKQDSATKKPDSATMNPDSAT